MQYRQNARRLTGFPGACGRLLFFWAAFGCVAFSPFCPERCGFPYRKASFASAMRSIMGTPNGQRVSQPPQAMQSAAFAERLP